MKALRFKSNKLWAHVREWTQLGDYTDWLVTKSKIYADSIPQIWGDEWCLPDLRRRYPSADFSDTELVPIHVEITQLTDRTKVENTLLDIACDVNNELIVVGHNLGLDDCQQDELERGVLGALDFNKQKYIHSLID